MGKTKEEEINKFAIFVEDQKRRYCEFLEDIILDIIDNKIVPINMIYEKEKETCYINGRIVNIPSNKESITIELLRRKNDWSKSY